MTDAGPPAAFTAASLVNVKACKDVPTSFARIIGRSVVGWFNRMPQTVATRRILAEEGFLYDSSAVNDDIPYFQDVKGRPFLVVPYTVDVNDFRF